MNSIIYESDAYKLSAEISTYKENITLTLSSLWPSANHPEWVRTSTLTLPDEGFARLHALLGRIGS